MFKKTLSFISLDLLLVISFHLIQFDIFQFQKYFNIFQGLNNFLARGKLCGSLLSAFFVASGLFSSTYFSTGCILKFCTFFRVKNSRIFSKTLQNFLENVTEFSKES